MTNDFPLGELSTALRALPRASLGRVVSPAVSAESLAPGLWIKRDDLNAPVAGGNKVRALELLLAGIAPDERVVTVGGWGSTHALATALHAQRLGARAATWRWKQAMTPTAERVAALTDRHAEGGRVRTLPGAYARAAAARIGGARWIPAGGSSPLGVLGHVNAALELAAQVAAGALPMPARIVLPLGSGGTAAGLLLGFAIAGLDIEIVGARVVPRILGNSGHVRTLAHRTARLMRRLGAPVPRRLGQFTVAHEAFAGAYGRESPRGRAAADRLRALEPGIECDPTYSAKALAVALARADGRPTLFWLTFDARMIA